jgi:hypothetical protein
MQEQRKYKTPFVAAFLRSKSVLSVSKLDADFTDSLK